MSSQKFPFIKSFHLGILCVASALVGGCGGSKESTDSTPSVSQTPEVPKEAASTEPTMQNMQNALVDAMKVISTDTIAEITQLAKNQEAIAIPDSFEKVQSALASAGQSDLFKGLSSSLNSSALGALGDYKDVIGSTIESIGLPDVDQILQGGDDSLTRYVESAAGSTLKNSLIPYVKEAAKNAGAQEWIDKIKDALPEDTGGLLGKVSAATGVNLPTNFNVESYLTDELMGKFFSVMATQEKLFRENPKGRSAELFEKIMSAAE